MSERELELSKQYVAGTEKLRYFLLTSAGASIGYAITLSESLPFSWPDILVMMAILSWAVSFWAGVRTLSETNEFLRANQNYLKVVEEIPQHRTDLLRIATEMSFDPLNRAISRNATLQLRALVTGATFLVFWRIAKAYDWSPAALFATLFTD